MLDPSNAVSLKKPILLKKGDVFGAESASQLLGTNVCTVTVVAHKGSLEVQGVDSTTLAKMLRIEPTYSKVFWRWLASLQAFRLNGMLKTEILNSGATQQPQFASSYVPSPTKGSTVTSLPSRGSSSSSEDEQMQTARRLSQFFPEWRRKMSTMKNRETTLLIKKFDVRWLSSRSELFVTQRGVGVLSRTRTGFKLSIPFEIIHSVDLKSVPNRRNGTDFVLTITSVSLSRRGARSQSMTNSNNSNPSNVTELNSNQPMAALASQAASVSTSANSNNSNAHSSSSRKNKKKEILVLFQSMDELKSAYDLIDYLHQSVAQTGDRDLTSLNHDSDPFDDFQLSAEDWQKLNDRSTNKSFAKGVCLVTAGTQVTSVMQIVAGTVRMISHGTTDRFLATLNDGDLIGDSDFALSSPHSFTYFAETEVECTLMDVEQLRVLLVAQPGLAGRMFRFLCSTISGRSEAIRSALKTE